MTKTDMADRFDVPLQNYRNWLERASLPKEHYERAHAMLLLYGKSDGNLLRPKITLQDLWDSSSPEERERFLVKLASLSSKR